MDKKRARFIILILAFIPWWTAHAQGGVAWASHTVTVDPAIETEVGNALAANPPTTNPSYYAITDVYQATGTLWIVSVVGLGNLSSPPAWTLDDAVWMGSVAVQDNGDGTYTSAVSGSQQYNALTVGVVFGESGGGGGSGFGGDPNAALPLFPFAPGTSAIFGVAGVHSAGFGYGWYAVDWLGGTDFGDTAMPPSVYGSQTEEIRWVCRDGISVAVGTDHFIYAHLEDNSALQTGALIERGVKFASIKFGTFNGNCGYTDQLSNHYHVHWGFDTQGAGTLTMANGWTLDIATETWRRGAEEVTIGNWMFNDTNTVPDITITNIQNFWDAFVANAITSAQEIASKLPTHQYLSIPETMLKYARVVIRIAYVLINANFNTSVMLWVFGIITSLEILRWSVFIFRAATGWVRRAGSVLVSLLAML